MPIYEYVCPSCDTKFEKMRPMSRANDKAECPDCKKESERVLSTFACCSTDSTGMTQSIAGSGGGCAGCASGSCSTCAS